MAGKRIKLLAALLSASVVIGCCSVNIGAEPDESEDNTYYYEEQSDGEDGEAAEDSEDEATEESDSEYDNEVQQDDEASDDEENSGDGSEEGSGESSAASQLSFSSFDETVYEDQHSQLQQENSELKDEIKQTNKDIKAKEKYSKELQKQISELADKINKSRDSIKTLNNEIREKQKRIEELLAQIDDIMQMLRVRLHKVHMAGDTSSLEIILGAKSFSDYIDKSEMIRSMAEYDQSLIDSIEGEMDIIAEEQRQLKAAKEKVEAEKRSMEKNKQKLDELSDENTKVIEELKKTRDDLRSQMKNNEDMQKQLEDALAAYNKKKAEEARRQRLLQNPEIVVPQSGEECVWPCPGFTYLTSTFDEWRGSNNHGALDIADAGIYGAKVVACYDGVVFSTWDTCDHDYGKFSSCGCGGGYGNYVMIDHGNGKISIYGHLSGVTVSPGQTVQAGQLIGYVGSTGYSTGPHLHFEMRYNGVRYDPLTEF